MKLENMVKFPLTGLDMTPHVVKRSQSSWSLPSHWSPWRRPYGLGRDPEDYVYDLYAVCNHHGTMQGGHYTGVQRAGPGLCGEPQARRAWGRVTLLSPIGQCASWEGAAQPLALRPRPPLHWTVASCLADGGVWTDRCPSGRPGRPVCPLTPQPRFFLLP